MLSTEAILCSVIFCGGWLLDAKEMPRQSAACDWEAERKGWHGNAAEWPD